MTDLTRRQALLLTLATGLPLIAGTGRARAQSAAQKVTVALDWTVNTNHIGLFVARDKGFYREAGLEVDILPYSDTGAGTLVANRVADFGINGTISLFTQRTAGADLKGVYAVVQSETGRVVFNAARNEIKSPRSLDGLIYGGFGSAWENALISTIIRHDGGKGNFETVTLGTSAYEALANGSVDFTLEVSTWEGVEAELRGVKQRSFVYADYGVPDEHTTLISSSEAYLQANPKPAADFVQATRRGYQFAVDHPDDAATLLIAANKDALTNPALIHASLKALIDGHYLRSQSGAIGTMDPAKMEAIGDYLFASGILRDSDGKLVARRPDFGSYFRNDYLS
ncbi:MULTISPECIES: ABC transporter substrate-binding protein [Mesorhizobium]|uniref:ABC transporter substrate-binding protein n=2 Tax=Phyllobacteriaceae TaxID=69277 RepID=UPI0007A93B76|nr:MULTISPECIES: ABC transporter substrate-binding protein [Mesorhizobium]RUZ84525.1 ABC transporter substrate-binding protein [Mesorhizobium sp. M7A.F.Ca.US.003.02.2.1]AMX93906.1 myristoyl transferase [Mesorhizobium ciceri]MDF3208627.1 ABC transporter substrate-binding protein [Mesorhizobium sp. LMG15046]MDF3228802.1 ABC transporter substrate-binding protein [Mesorhizobium sp. DSM 30133]RUU19244.1 ABC transporter substrate-binding protein [Mesorhizobium sp. Primo-B]